MAKSLEERARQGKDKLTEKKGDMHDHYDKAVPLAIRHFEDVGFGPLMTGNYKDGMKHAPGNFRDGFDDDAIDLWADRWLDKARA